MMRTSNPAMNPAYFERAESSGLNESMTVQGAVNKCFVLFFILLATAAWVWNKMIQSAPLIEYDQQAAQTTASVIPFVVGGGIGGLILALVTVFKKNWAKITAPLYAACEGFVLGGISAIYEMQYPGIVIQAVGLTFGTLFCMLTLYRTGVIKVTQKFVLGLSAATGAIFLVYLVNFVMGFFGAQIPMIHGYGMVGIGFSFLVVGIAAFNLVLDFYIIEEGAARGAPKYMEWYGAFALMVTLVWLYLEILRLLAKLQRRR